MTLNELKQIRVVHEIPAGRMTAKLAAGMLSLATRQVRRLIERQLEGGDDVIAHGNCGAPVLVG